MANERPVQLKDIAQRAGVSVSTVSMALSNHASINAQTRQRVQALSREMGYRKRRRKVAEPRSAEPQRFGFLLLGSRLQDEVHTADLHALSVQAAALGIRTEVRAIEDTTDADAMLDQAVRYVRHLDGVVLSGYVSAALLTEIEAIGVPYVVLGHTLQEPERRSGFLGQIVDCDCVAMGLIATRHLLFNDHRRIAFICERLPTGLWSHRWLRGYRTAIAEAGIQSDDRLVQVTGVPFSGAEPAVQALLEMNASPTGFVVPDIRVGASLMEAVTRHGLSIKPADVVIGGRLELVERYNMGRHPWIGFPRDELAAIAIRQLRSLAHEPMPCITDILVPFETHHIHPAASTR